MNTTIQRIDAVLTDQEMSAKELKDSIYQKSNEIKNRYALLINGSMSAEKIAELNNETLLTIERVKAAKSIDEVNSITDSYMNAHPLEAASTKQNNVLLIVIIASVSACALVGGVLAAFFLIRKKKTK